jgi:hypothetical protein
MRLHPSMGPSIDVRHTPPQRKLRPSPVRAPSRTGPR